MARYGSGNNETIITEYLDAHLENGIKQKNLDLVLDLMDKYVELKEIVLEVKAYGNPKKVQKLLDRRERIAMNLISVTAELDTWLEKNGADFTDFDIIDSTLSGCMIYCEPVNARNNVEDYIKNKM